MAETTTFAASGEEAITRQIHVEKDEAPHDPSHEDFDDYFEIERTVQEVLKHDYKRVALQFPDELLHVSVPIYRRLKSKVGDGHDFYVLADTSYGSCCVDEVAAQHVDADAMVHYGHACMSQTSRLPVIYVFGKSSVEVEDCVARLAEAAQLSETASPRILLRTDVRYAHAAERIAESLRDLLPSTSSLQYYPVSRFTLPAADGPARISGSTDEEEQYDTILYVGSESLGLTNLLLTHSFSTVYSYDPRQRTARHESVRTNALLMRRYAAVQKARDADVFGILVGTLGVASYLPLISRLRTLLARAQKKSYTLAVGKLNPAKLGNFLEVECFVLVACPENSVVDAREFLRPIVTPYELELALQSEPAWTGRYVLDFSRLALQDADAANAAERADGQNEDDEDADRPMFSLVTGTYRQAKRYGAPPPDEPPSNDSDAPSAVVLRNQENALSALPDSAASQFLQARTYRGLETRIGEDAPSVLEQGRSGIARGYQTDHRA